MPQALEPSIAVTVFITVGRWASALGLDGCVTYYKHILWMWGEQAGHAHCAFGGKWLFSCSSVKNSSDIRVSEAVATLQ